MLFSCIYLCCSGCCIYTVWVRCFGVYAPRMIVVTTADLQKLQDSEAVDLSGVDIRHGRVP